jgi:hypothetical protein
MSCPLSSHRAYGEKFRLLQYRFQKKMSTLQLKYHIQNSVENLVGFFDMGILWWLSHLFWSGRGVALVQSNLYELERDLKSNRLRDRVALSWDESMSQFWTYSLNLTLVVGKSDQHAFLSTFSSCILEPFLNIIPFRVLSILLQYSQTFLITAAIDVFEKPASERDKTNTRSLISATIFIYLGMAVSTTS